MSAKPTLPVKGNVRGADRSVCESRNIGYMAYGPRQPRITRKRGPFGERLRSLRLARGLTQIELAVETGISRSHIAAMETGADPPCRENLHALATFFDVSMDYLQSGLTQSPQQGAFVEDVEELALLALWRQIPVSERPRIARMLRAAALDSNT